MGTSSVALDAAKAVLGARGALEKGNSNAQWWAEQLMQALGGPDGFVRVGMRQMSGGWTCCLGPSACSCGLCGASPCVVHPLISMGRMGLLLLSTGRQGVQLVRECIFHGPMDPWVQALSCMCMCFVCACQVAQAGSDWPRCILPFDPHNARLLPTGIVVYVFVRPELAPHVGEVSTASVACGLMGVAGNKGAVAVSLSLYRRRLLFLSSHFAAHQVGGCAAVWFASVVACAAT